MNRPDYTPSQNLFTMQWSGGFITDTRFRNHRTGDWTMIGCVIREIYLMD